MIAVALGPLCNVVMPGCTPPTAFTKYIAPPPSTSAPIFVGASSRQGAPLSSGIVALIVVVVVCALLLLVAAIAAALWRSRRASSTSSFHDQPLATAAPPTSSVDNDYILQPSYGALASSQAFAFPTTPTDDNRNVGFNSSNRSNDALPFTAPPSDAPSYELKRGEDEQLQRAPSNAPHSAAADDDDDVTREGYAVVNASLRESNNKPSY